MQDKKLVVCIMGQDVESHIEMCLNSVKDADAIVYCDGGSTDGTVLSLVKNNFGSYGARYAKEYQDEIDKAIKNYKEMNRTMIYNSYDKSDKTMNGKQRNFYLKYLKKNYPDYWALCLDADEVLEEDGIEKIKKFIQTAKDGAYSVKMEHLIGDLLHVDGTKDKHLVMCRLFKVDKDLKYPEVEHPVLQHKSWSEPKFIDKHPYQSGTTECTTIWHLAYILAESLMFKERYENNIKNSNIHNKEFLDSWYSAHLFGNYPKRQIQPTDLPEVLLNFLGYDKDSFYFANRGLEIKHFMMVKNWVDYFEPDNVIELGCGRAPFGFAFEYNAVDYQGIELSNFAVNNSFVPIKQGDISTYEEYREYNLVMAFDVLEHLDDKTLDKALKNITKLGKTFLLSVPVIGDPNLDNDKTHKQFKSKEDWIKTFESYGIKIKETPSDWLFANQIFIGELNNDR